MSFEKEFAKESANAIKAAREVVRVTAIELFSGVITRSPVGNPDLWKEPKSIPPGYTGGSFRANWYLTQTVPSVKYDADKKTSEGEMISGVTAQIASKQSSSWYLTNNAPYSERLENGWSSQAPAGIIAPERSRIDAMFDRIVAVANRKYGVS